MLISRFLRQSLLITALAALLLRRKLKPFGAFLTGCHQRTMWLQK